MVFGLQEGNWPFTFRGREKQLQSSVSNHEKLFYNKESIP
jgi:hypothetical protein